jgi:hypothetical protein
LRVPIPTVWRLEHANLIPSIPSGDPNVGRPSARIEFGLTMEGGEQNNLIDPNSILALGRPTFGSPLGILGMYGAWNTQILSPVSPVVIRTWDGPVLELSLDLSDYSKLVTCTTALEP